MIVLKSLIIEFYVRVDSLGSLDLLCLFAIVNYVSISVELNGGSKFQDEEFKKKGDPRLTAKPDTKPGHEDD